MSSSEAAQPPCSGGSAAPSAGDDMGGVRMLGERVAYKGWKTVIKRRFLFPETAKEVEFDLSHSANAAVFVFVWHSASKSATLVEEFYPGPQRWMSGVVAGIAECNHDPHTGRAAKHESTMQAAQFELSEEAQLEGGLWFPLVHNSEDAPHCQPDPTSSGPGGATSSMFDSKFSTQRYHYYLCVDPVPATEPRPLDDDEHINILKGVSANQVLELVLSGKTTATAALVMMLALHKLRQLGELPA